jgi:hypothetical protein
VLRDIFESRYHSTLARTGESAPEPFRARSILMISKLPARGNRICSSCSAKDDLTRELSWIRTENVCAHWISSCSPAAPRSAAR